MLADRSTDISSLAGLILLRKDIPATDVSPRRGLWWLHVGRSFHRHFVPGGTGSASKGHSGYRHVAPPGLMVVTCWQIVPQTFRPWRDWFCFERTFRLQTCRPAGAYGGYMLTDRSTDVSSLAGLVLLRKDIPATDVTPRRGLWWLHVGRSFYRHFVPGGTDSASKGHSGYRHVAPPGLMVVTCWQIVLQTFRPWRDWFCFERTFRLQTFRPWRD
jgi:hypothetical protein